MANLSYLPLQDIGINGLNTQNHPSSLDPSWFTESENMIVNESARVGFRKGFEQKIRRIHSTYPIPSFTATKIGSIVEHLVGDDYKVFAAISNKIYTVDFTDPDTAFTSPFSHTSGVKSDWQFVNFNKQLYGFQAGTTPINYDSTDVAPWDELKDRTGFTAPSGVTTFDPSCGTGYYGRLWVGGISEEKDVLYYSDTLIGKTWNSGLSGYIDLKTVWGTDEIVAIHPFYGQLVIFGKKNIILYQNVSDTLSINLNEVIRGIGCVSRDSIQAIGDDLYFLSENGLRSLARTSQLDKVPLTELSVNIQDSLLDDIALSTTVKSCYMKNEGLYLMSFVDRNTTYVFNLKQKVPNGVPSISKWSFYNDLHPASITYTESQGTLVGQHTGGIATYSGYKDTILLADNSENSSEVGDLIPYSASFRTTWLNLGDSTVAVLLKKLKFIFYGGIGVELNIQSFVDFSNSPSKPLTISLSPQATGISYYWGAATSLYGQAKYKVVSTGREYALNLMGRAKFLQFKVYATSNNENTEMVGCSLLYKQGKIR